MNTKQRSCGRIHRLISMATILALFLMTLTACGKTFSEPYAQVKRAVWELRRYKTNNDNPVVQYMEDYSVMDNSHVLGKADVILIDFTFARDQVEPVSDKLKEKLQGLEVPWIYDTTVGQNETLKALRDLDCKDVGVILDHAGEEETPPLDGIGGLTRLWIRKGDAVPSWLTRFPKVKELRVPIDYSLDDAPKLSALRSLYIPEGGWGAAAAYAYLTRNPGIETVNDKPAKNYSYTQGLEEKELAYYNQSVQRIDVSRIDTSGYRVIPFDQARLHGRIAVVGYGYSTQSMNGFNTEGRNLSKKLLGALTDSPTKRDVIVRVTSESKVIGKYTDGTPGSASYTYFEVIDPAAKTITKKTYMEGTSSYPSQVIQNGKGSHSGGFSLKAGWEAMERVFQEKYSK